MEISGPLALWPPLTRGIRSKEGVLPRRERTRVLSLKTGSFAELSVLAGCLQECTFLCVRARDWFAQMHLAPRGSPVAESHNRVTVELL